MSHLPERVAAGGRRHQPSVHTKEETPRFVDRLDLRERHYNRMFPEKCNLREVVEKMNVDKVQ